MRASEPSCDRFGFQFKVIFFPETHVIARHHRNDNIYSNNYLLLANALFLFASSLLYFVYISFFIFVLLSICVNCKQRDCIRFQFVDSVASKSTAIDCVLRIARAAFSLLFCCSHVADPLVSTQTAVPNTQSSADAAAADWRHSMRRQRRTNALNVADSYAYRFNSCFNGNTPQKAPALYLPNVNLHTYTDDKNKNFTIRSYFIYFFFSLSSFRGNRTWACT